MYYHVRKILKRLQVSLPHEAGCNAADNPYTNKEFFKICEDYGVSHNPMRYQDEKFHWTYQLVLGGQVIISRLGPDSMTHWIIEKSQGFTNGGCLKYQRV